MDRLFVGCEREILAATVNDPDRLLHFFRSAALGNAAPRPRFHDLPNVLFVVKVRHREDFDIGVFARDHRSHLNVLDCRKIDVDERNIRRERLCLLAGLRALRFTDDADVLFVVEQRNEARPNEIMVINNEDPYFPLI